MAKTIAQYMQSLAFVPSPSGLLVSEEERKELEQRSEVYNATLTLISQIFPNQDQEMSPEEMEFAIGEYFVTNARENPAFPNPLANSSLNAFLQAIKSPIGIGLIDQGGVGFSNLVKNISISNEADQLAGAKRQFTGYIGRSAAHDANTPPTKVAEDRAKIQTFLTARMTEISAMAEKVSMPEESRKKIAEIFEKAGQELASYTTAAVNAKAQESLVAIFDSVANVGDAVKHYSAKDIPLELRSSSSEFRDTTANQLDPAQVPLLLDRAERAFTPSREQLVADRFLLDRAERASLPSAKDKFVTDRNATMAQVQNYIERFPQPLPSATVDELQSRASDIIATATDSPDPKSAISDAMKDLERARDARSGISLVEAQGETGVPVIVRDARNCSPNLKRGPEAFQIQYLNMVRAALDMAEIEGLPDLKAEILQQASDFMATFPKDELSLNLDERLKQEGVLATSIYAKRNKAGEIIGTPGAMDRIGALFTARGVEHIDEKLNIAKDFQGLSTQHYDVATLTTTTDKDGIPHAIVEAEVGYRELTQEQRDEYLSITAENEADRPAWFNSMTWWEQELCLKYVPAIMDGAHTIPTQLWQLVGMKNAFEKTTAVVGPDGQMEVVAQEKHAGTLASVARDKSARQGISDQNTDQFREWIGKDIIPQVNSLNSHQVIRGVKKTGKERDVDIITQLGKSVSAAGGEYINTAFNAARIGSASNVLDGVSSVLGDVSSSLSATAAANPAHAGDIATLKAHLEPKPGSFFGRLRRAVTSPINTFRRVFFSPEKAMDRLQAAHVMDEASCGIVDTAIGLRKSSDRMQDSVFTRGEGNASLEASTLFGKLGRQIVGAKENGNEITGLPNLQARESIFMCASGKDRTGLRAHDGSSSAVAEKLGVSTASVDKAIVSGGHTAQQAGGSFSCGSSAGCFGTRRENILGVGNVISALKAYKGRKKFTEHLGKDGRNANLSGLVEKSSEFADNHTHPAEGEEATIGGFHKDTRGQEAALARRAANDNVSETSIPQPEQTQAATKESGVAASGVVGESTHAADHTHDPAMAKIIDSPEMAAVRAGLQGHEEDRSSNSADIQSSREGSGTSFSTGSRCFISRCGRS